MPSVCPHLTTVCPWKNYVLGKFCQIEDAGVIAVPIPMENFWPQQPVNFSSCQQILMKTFQNDANTPIDYKNCIEIYLDIFGTLDPCIVKFLGLGKSHIKWKFKDFFKPYTSWISHYVNSHIMRRPVVDRFGKNYYLLINFSVKDKFC